MSREEAIKIIKECKEKGFKHTFYTLNQFHEALDVAIKALEQEPCNTDTCKVVKAYMNEWDKPNNSDVISRQYEKHIDHTDCIWHGIGSCPVTCSQYRDGWNDAMDYIFKNGNGYQPYRRD